jgi:hypothetical protein
MTPHYAQFIGAILALGLVFLGLALLGVPFRSAWPAWFKVWKDCTQNVATGHYVAKDVYKFWFAVGGLAYLFFLVPAFAWFDRELDQWPGLFLCLTSLGYEGSKLLTAWNNRKTKDAAGNELTIPEAQAQPGTTPPLPLQPQGPAIPQAAD